MSEEKILEEGVGPCDSSSLMRASKVVSYWRAGTVGGLFPWHWAECLVGPMTVGWRDKWPKLTGVEVRLQVSAPLLSSLCPRSALLQSPASSICSELLLLTHLHEDVLLNVLLFSTGSEF